MHGLDWNDIRAFLAVAEAGQIGRAARKLKVDPTTLGRRLARLESYLEVTIFERMRDGQTLTDAGEKLLEKAELMFEAARAIDEAKSASRVLGGTLRISVSEGFGTRFLTHYLSNFSDLHPDLTVELVASSGFLSPSKREADIAVMLSRPKVGPVVCRKLADYRLRLYANPAYLEGRNLPKFPADLSAGHRLIGYVPDLLYAPELNYLDEFLPGLEPHLRSSSINAQFHLAKNGAGIAVLPCFIGDSSDSLRVICPEISITRSFWLVTHRDTQGLARIRAGKQWLNECVIAGGSRLLPA